MNAVLQNLLKLQALEFGDVAGKSIETQVAELRGLIPQPILGHYDRLRVRGKKGVATIRNQVCSGCHMQIPIGTITVIMREDDIQLCENCGRYLIVPDQSKSAPVVEPVAAVSPPVKPAAKRAAKPAAKPRKGKPLALAI